MRTVDAGAGGCDVEVVLAASRMRVMSSLLLPPTRRPSSLQRCLSSGSLHSCSAACDLAAPTPLLSKGVAGVLRGFFMGGAGSWLDEARVWAILGISNEAADDEGVDCAVAKPPARGAMKPLDNLGCCSGVAAAVARKGRVDMLKMPVRGRRPQAGIGA